MPKKKRKSPGLSEVPPAEYTSDTYEYEIRLVRSKEGKAIYQVLQGGKLLIREAPRHHGQEADTCNSASSLRTARSWARRTFFHNWDQARIEALGGISHTLRSNASQYRWEPLQTFNEKITLPTGYGRKLRQAVLARKRADEAIRQAQEARRELVTGLVNELGMSYGDAGTLLGLTRQRIHVLLKEPRAAEPG